MTKSGGRVGRSEKYEPSILMLGAQKMVEERSKLTKRGTEKEDANST